MGWLLFLPLASAASSGGRTHRRRGLTEKGCSRTSRRPTSCQWLCGVSIVSHEALCSSPAAAGLPLTAEKSFPACCKVTGRLPIERKPVDNVSQKKRSPPHSFLSSTARVFLVPMLTLLASTTGEVTIPFFSYIRPQITNKNETLTS